MCAYDCSALVEVPDAVYIHLLSSGVLCAITSAQGGSVS